MITGTRHELTRIDKTIEELCVAISYKARAQPAGYILRAHIFTRYTSDASKINLSVYIFELALICIDAYVNLIMC